MPDYQSMYHKTYNAITDAERLIDQAKEILRTTQQECEKMYIETEDTPPEDNK